MEGGGGCPEEGEMGWSRMTHVVSGLIFLAAASAAALARLFSPLIGKCHNLFHFYV